MTALPHLTVEGPHGLLLTPVPLATTSELSATSHVYRDPVQTVAGKGRGNTVGRRASRRA
jgi:hypothetical protein